ncbi:MAG: hypothetical protein KF891_02655 [Rhizobacter sp.]|nr:hypothetical protein [Rhizobacter sp.]
MHLHTTPSAGGANLPQPVPEIIVPLPSTRVPPAPDVPPPEVIEPPLPGGHFPFHEPAWPVPQAMCLS